MAEESIIIDVQVNADDVQKDLAKAIESVAQLKEEQKALRKEIEAGNDVNGDYAKRLVQVSSELERNQRQVKSQTAILQAATAEGLKQNASLDEQRQYLNQLQKAYASLSGDAKATADAEGGLRDQIKALSDSVKEQEQAIGDARRNVGNYTESLLKATDAAGTGKQALEGLGLGSTKAAKGMDGLDKIGKAFAKNPTMAVIAIIGGLLAKMLDGLKQNEEAMGGVKVATASMGSAFKALQPIINAVSKIFVDVFLKALNWVMDAIKSVLGWVDALAKKFGKDLGLVSAFEAGAAAAQEETEVIKEETGKQVKTQKEAADTIGKLRDEMAKRRRTDLENELAELNAKQAEELKTAKLTEEEKQEIRDYYAGLRNDTLRKYEEAEAKAAEEEKKRAEETERVKLEARNKALLALGLEEGLTPEAAELMALQKYRNDDLINAEEYEQAKTLIKEKYAKKRNDISQQEVDKAAEAYETAAKSAASSSAAALQALSSLLGEYAEDSEEAAKAQKAFAMGALLVNQALSIAEGAKGIAAAMAGAAEAAAATGPAAPIMLALYQAQMVGQVLAVVTSVASTISQAKSILGTTQAFANGGVIGGYTSSPSGADNTYIHAATGEMVLNASQQKRLFEIANSSMQGADYSGITAAMAAAVSAMPAPVMDYREFTEFTQNVTTYKELAAI